MTAPAPTESFSFQAEVVQILDLMIHSLYSNKEIFLRELISNGSDAIDRLRFESVSGSVPQEELSGLAIRVAFDPGARTITVTDNGIGMSRDEVIGHIGTIAKSGTAEFLRALTGDQRKDATLIGQFGVGFYSAFIVADKVTLTTRRAGLPAGEGVRWESDGKGEYTLETVERPERGTEVVLHLREGEDELLNGFRLRSIIQRYSDHISMPILMPAEAGAPGSTSQAAGAGETTGDGEAEGGGGQGAGAAGPGETVVNRASALWARPKSEISEQDYFEFYRHVAHDFADPLAYLHAKMEGTYEYTLLLFVPSRAPFDLWMPEPSRGVKLHVQRVFIMEDSGQLMPAYLRFVRGVIDSSDLPLNVSREILQSSRVVDSIRTSAVKRVLKLLKDLAADEPEKYATFWKEFGTVLKEGMAEDFANQDEIAGLLRFASTRSGSLEPAVSLADYTGRMREGQDKVYYLVAPSLAAAESSPHLEAFRAKGVEVLLLGDPVDHWVVANLREFGGKPLQSVAHGALDLGALEDDAERQDREKAISEFGPLLERLKDALGGKVTGVRVTSRLTGSPACLVAGEPDSAAALMQRLRGPGLPSQPVLEINPQHPLVARLQADQDLPHFADWAQVLYGQAVLTLGGSLEDPAAFVGGLNTLLASLAGETSG